MVYFISLQSSHPLWAPPELREVLRYTEESVDLHEQADKENEQTLANLSPAEETTDKDEVEIEKFLQGSR